jgi:hypothetical protein
MIKFHKSECGILHTFTTIQTHILKYQQSALTAETALATLISSAARHEIK